MHKLIRKTIPLALLPVLLQSGSALAQTLAANSAAPVASAELDEVIVTGTRQSGLKAADSAAPIQILSATSIQNASGSPDLVSTLAKIVPSLTAQGFGGDTANATLQAKLRGLSPNDVLVLVDGKRRHTTSNLAVDAGPFQGAAGVDLNFIPVGAIDHIEVLTDGAAAQYGSDAIAGVINIILKKDSSGGDLSGTYGRYIDGGGITGDYTGHIGFEPLVGGYLNFTGEVRNHGFSDRGGIDGRTLNPDVTYPNSNWTSAPGYPHLNLILGDAQYNLKLLTYNSGFDFGGGTEFYSFGTYGYKDTASYENYRTPSTVSYTGPLTGGVTNYPFPYGFDPQEAFHETDYELTAGVRGKIASWNWDLSSSYGVNHVNEYTVNSANAGIFGGYSSQDPATGVVTEVAGTDSTPRDFYDGFFKSAQWTNNLDFNRDFDVGLAGPLNVAFGGEYRRNVYQLGAGEPASYVGGGAQSQPGLEPVDAGTHTRTNDAAYVDLAVKPIEDLRVDAAGRYEHYSDFGDKTVGKLTARYDFVPAFAVRGTISTGFRAPTLAEEYYTSTNVSPDSATVQLQPNSKASADLGLGNLKPETSTNYSFGFVFHPTAGLIATLDLFQIDIKNRIVGSGTVNSVVNGVRVGTPDADGYTPIEQAILDSGNATPNSIVPGGSYGVNLFVNGINTQTRGADFVLDFPVDYEFGKIDWTIGATYNDTTITNIAAAPAQLAGQPVFATGSTLFDQTALSDLTSASPKYVINLGALLTVDKLTVDLREIIYGTSSEYDSNGGHTVNGNSSTVTYYNNVIGVTPITNLDVGYQASHQLKLSVGAINLFDRYPNKVNDNLLAGYAATYNRSTVDIYPQFSPFGFNGGYYYVRANYKF
jgi:iron complex outermembrane recepter protein